MTKKEASEHLRALHERLLRERPSYRQANETVRRNMQAAQRHNPELFLAKNGDRDD